MEPKDILIKLNEASYDNALEQANRQAKSLFLLEVDFRGYKLNLKGTNVEYYYPLDQTFFNYEFYLEYYE